MGRGDAGVAGPPGGGLSGLSVVTQPCFGLRWGGCSCSAADPDGGDGVPPPSEMGQPAVPATRVWQAPGPPPLTPSSGGLRGSEGTGSCRACRAYRQALGAPWFLFPAPAPPSCSRTASCLAASVPSLASWPPQPWVLGAGQGLPAVSFLPFFGRKPGWWGAPGWSLSRGGGLGHHPVPQSDSAPCPHPSLGSLGHSGRWINGVAAHAGPRAQATPAGRPA